MSQPLIIWLPDDLDAPWQWFQGDRYGVASSDADKSGLRELDTSPVQIIISGQSITRLRHDLPPMKEGDRLSAAGFAIENQIASPLASQHLVLGSAHTDMVFIISHMKMKDVLDHLSNASISPSGLYADFDVLPLTRPILLKDRAIYPQDGYTVDREWGGDGDAEDQLSQLINAFDFNSALNLMTGDYAAKSTLPFSTAGLLRIAALFAVAFIAWLGLLWTQTRAISQQTAALKTETANLYTSATGQSAPPNPALTVTRAIKKGGGSQQAGFLELSNLLFESLAQTQSIIIETLQYDHQKNQLTLRLVYPQFESADALETLITNNGGTFRSGGVREQGGRLIGDAVLEAAP